MKSPTNVLLPGKRSLVIAFFLYQGIFWIGILVPFDFYRPASLWDEWLTQWEKPQEGFIHAFSGLGHALFFVPLGIWFHVHATRRSWRRAGLIAAFTVLTALGSEFAQLFTSRGPSLSDFSMDLGGAALGYWFARRYRRSPRLRDWVHTVLSPRWLGAAFTLLLLAYVLAATPPASSFDNWNAGFPFIVGNEATRDRPWDGRVDEVLLFGRALDDAEVARTFAAPRLDEVSAPLLHYRFDAPAEDAASGVPRFVELSRRLPRADVFMVDGDRPVAPGAGLSVDADSFAMSGGPIPELCAVLQQSRALTLVVQFEANTFAVEGPGRIVSYSDGWLLRNFTLAQGEGDFRFRVRTPFTGLNGVNPELVAIGDVRPGETQRIIAVTDSRRSRLYVDGRLVARTAFSYLPCLEVAFFDRTLEPHMRFALLVAAWLAMMLLFGTMLLRSLGASLWLELTACLLASAGAVAIYAFDTWIA